MTGEGMTDEPQDAPRGYGDEAWFDKLTFVFARTLPQIPHEYTVRTPENEDAFVKLWETIKERGVPGKFTSTDGKTRYYRYWYRGDGWRYWVMAGLQMSRIINRAKVEGIEGDGHELLDPDGSGGGPR